MTIYVHHRIFTAVLLTAAAVLPLTACSTGPTEQEAVLAFATPDAKEYFGEDLAVAAHGAWEYEDGYAVLFSITGQGDTGAYTEYYANYYTEGGESWARQEVAKVSNGLDAPNRPHQAACYSLSDELGKDATQCDAIEE